MLVLRAQKELESFPGHFEKFRTSIFWFYFFEVQCWRGISHKKNQIQAPVNGNCQYYPVSIFWFHNHSETLGNEL